MMMMVMPMVIQVTIRMVLDCPPAKQEGRRRRKIGKRRRWSDSSMVVHLQSTFTVCRVG